MGRRRYKKSGRGGGWSRLAKIREKRARTLNGLSPLISNNRAMLAKASAVVFLVFLFMVRS